jgi:hypothetical protein
MIRKYAEFCTSQLPTGLFDFLTNHPETSTNSVSVNGFLVVSTDYGWDFYIDKESDEDEDEGSAYPELTDLLQDPKIAFARFDRDAAESGMLPSFPNPSNDPPDTTVYHYRIGDRVRILVNDTFAGTAIVIAQVCGGYYVKQDRTGLSRFCLPRDVLPLPFRADSKE